MEENNYWKRLARRRLSRRRLLSGAVGVGAGLVALSLLGCEEEEEVPLTPTPSPPAMASPTPTPWALEPLGTRGGTYRSFGWEAMPVDTYDPHQTQFPHASMHSAVFSKVLQYDDICEGIIVPDLAEGMPEVVDELTYVIKIRPNVRFHDTEKIRKNFPQVAGRQLTAEDVKYSIERQANKESPKAPLYYRGYQWETVDKIEIIDPLTLRITTKRPTAPFIHYLADSWSFIIPKELVDPPTDDMNRVDKMIGSGPFILDNFITLQVSKCIRNPDWFAKDDLANQGLPDRPLIDGYQVVWTPQDDTAIEAAFRSKQVDVTGFIDLGNAERVAAETGAVWGRGPVLGLVTSRILVNDSENATTPLKDFRLRQAISIAIDRNRMGQQIFQGFFYLGTPVGLALRRWAMSVEELTKKPGYRFKKEEREEDLANARQMWEAAGGLAIEPFSVVYAAIPDYVKNYWPQFQKTLAEVLGLEVKGHLDATGYTELAQGFALKRIVLSFNYENGYNDPDDWLYAYFHSKGAKNSHNLADPDLDRMLDAQREEFDYERRRQIVQKAQNYLLDKVQARLDWVGSESLGVLWPYLKNYRPTPWFGNNFHLANLWLDKNDPSFQGRPA